MKTCKKILAVLLIAVLALNLLCACGKNSETLTVILGDESKSTYEVPLDKLSEQRVVAALDYLKAENKLTYTAEDGAYGLYLTQIGDLAQDDAAGKYLMVYTSVASDADTSEFGMKETVNGLELTTAAVGISDMKLEAGATLYFALIQY